MRLCSKFKSVLEPRVTSNPGLGCSIFSNPSHFCMWNFFFRWINQKWLHPPKQSCTYKIAILAEIQSSQIAQFELLQWYSTRILRLEKSGYSAKVDNRIAWIYAEVLRSEFSPERWIFRNMFEIEMLQVLHAWVEWVDWAACWALNLEYSNTHIRDSNMPTRCLEYSQSNRVRRGARHRGNKAAHGPYSTYRIE